MTFIGLLTVLKFRSFGLGCPVRQEIRPTVLATACGDGLIKGCVGQIQSFIVDPKGQKGELVVQVEGSSSNHYARFETHT